MIKPNDKLHCEDSTQTPLKQPETLFSRAGACIRYPDCVSLWDHLSSLVTALRLQAGTLFSPPRCYCPCQHNKTDRRPWRSPAIWVLSDGATKASRLDCVAALAAGRLYVSDSSFLTECEHRLAACLHMRSSFVP